MALPRPIRPSVPQTTVVQVSSENSKREDVLRLVEAQIAGCVDLSPEEMVDAAFLIVKRIDDRLDGKV